jgi:hypothetical protein
MKVAFRAFRGPVGLAQVHVRSNTHFLSTGLLGTVVVMGHETHRHHQAVAATSGIGCNARNAAALKN